MAYSPSRCGPTTRCRQARRPALWRLRSRRKFLQTAHHDAAYQLEFSPFDAGSHNAYVPSRFLSSNCCLSTRRPALWRRRRRFGYLHTCVHTKRTLSSKTARKLQRHTVLAPLTANIHLLQRSIAFERTGQRNGAGDTNLIGCET